jgi:ectoine hydroxylase-related dioxygenase (phytanoyl-CoA dioxygenase family)
MSLTAAEKEQFITDGYIVVQSAFDVKHDTIVKWKNDVWRRCNVNREDPTSWPEKVHLPGDDTLKFQEVAPVAYGKVVEILGGEERLGGDLVLHNGFVCNFSMGRDEPWRELKDAGGWHADGDFFRHFLDSREQSCLIGSYFTDIEHRGGATLISPGSHIQVARFLAQHPEGVLPNFVGENQLIEQCDRFIEVLAKAGDVVIMHPLMLHSASQNKKNRVRLMNNNNIMLKEHFKFQREDGDYSLVEKATLRALGLESLDFKITAAREVIEPPRVKIQKEFAKKLAAEKAMD